MYNERIIYGDKMTVVEFIETCECGGFIDYDGLGHPAQGDYLDPTIEITPSGRACIPADATHIVWFNR